MKRELIQVSKIRKGEDFPISKHTFYHWSHIKKYPEIFCKVGRTLCVDADAFYKRFSPKPEESEAVK